MKIAFVGFRHGHVMGLWTQANAHAGVQVVAACEEDAATREELAKQGKVKITHNSYDQMLKEVECDAVAVGDYFGKRGERTIAALEAGKHVISDKPICTRLSEWETIAKLAKEKKRAIGCLLDLRDHGVYRAMRAVIHSGDIGEVHTINITAQHPLLLGKRANWYFEPGKHGGTINDMAIHAVDLIPWLTGRQVVEVAAARAWNVRADAVPGFQDAAQMMLVLDNRGGVLGDVSYLTPDGVAYEAKQYWRILCHGTNGSVEGWYGGKTIEVSVGKEKPSRTLPVESERTAGVLEDFLADVAGESTPDRLTTDQVLAASLKTLKIQQAADGGLTGVKI